VVVRRYRRAAELGGELEHLGLGRPDERATEIDGDTGDGGGVGSTADAVTGFENGHVVSESGQIASDRQSGEPSAHDDDVCHGAIVPTSARSRLLTERFRAEVALGSGL
jgi:hypothetical protein